MPIPSRSKTTCRRLNRNWVKGIGWSLGWHGGQFRMRADLSRICAGTEGGRGGVALVYNAGGKRDLSDYREVEGFICAAFVRWLVVRAQF
jgi:hypothetical protein